MTIKTRRIGITLGRLIDGHREEVKRIAEDTRSDKRWALDPASLRSLPIVRQVIRDGSDIPQYAIVDGFHRLAGMVVFGAESFAVIVVDAPAALLDAIDAGSEIGECPELDAIYASDSEARHAT